MTDIVKKVLGFSLPFIAAGTLYFGWAHQEYNRTPEVDIKKKEELRQIDNYRIPFAGIALPILFAHLFAGIPKPNPEDYD